MDASKLVRPEVKAIPPYNAGLTTAEVQLKYRPGRIAKLGSNESPLGPSPDVTDVGPELREMMRTYPDPHGRALKQKLEGMFGIGIDRIILGNGSEDLIAVVCRAVVRPNDAVLTLYPSFPLHEDYTTLMGGEIRRVQVDSEYAVDVEKFCFELRQRPRLAIFSNPMNPVGVALTLRQLERIIESVSPDTLLVIDEAYLEYFKGTEFGSALPLLQQRDINWLVLRTFSKAYGLAGLRVGYGLASDGSLVQFLDRVRTPFNVNALAQHAAVKALDDRRHLTRVVDVAHIERGRLTNALVEMGYRVAPSQGNFVFFDTTYESATVSDLLLRRGVIVKPWRQNGFETHLRVSAGNSEEDAQFLQAMKSVQLELQAKA